MAKSLLWVQKIAKIPALPNFKGLPTRRVITITEKNIILFDTRIDKRNSQLTWLSSSSARDMNMRDGRENVPTKVLIPFASVSEIKFIRPAEYLKCKKNNGYSFWNVTTVYLPAYYYNETLC